MDLLGVLTACTAIMSSFAAGWWFLSYSLYRHLGSERDVAVQVGVSDDVLNCLVHMVHGWNE